MSNETTVRKYLADKIHGHVVQIESHATSAGVPDTNFCVKGVDGWIEIKFVRGKNKIKVRNTQKTWFRRRLAAGATNLFLFLRHEISPTEKTHMLIRVVDRSVVDKLFKYPYPEIWKNYATTTWSNEVDEHELNQILRG